MPKYLPDELKDFYFPFNWDLEKLWGLPILAGDFAVAELEWHMDIPIWSSRKGGMLFDLCPRLVLDSPKFHQRHSLRIDSADLAYQIDAMESGGRLVMIDGVHRLAKAVRHGLDTIGLRIIPRDYLPIFMENA